MSSFVFKESPSDFLPRVEVVAVFCEYEGRYLFLKKTAGTNNGNLWGLPAGKIEPGESQEEAAVREVEEETGLQLQRERLIPLRSVYVRRPCDFVFHTYRYLLEAEPVVIRLSPSEHEEWRWATLDEVKELECIQGGHEAIHLVREELVSCTSR
jgi:mutator protein MutT